METLWATQDFSPRPDFRVALIYEDAPHSEGSHCLKALQPLCQVEHIIPAQLPQIFKESYDLFLRIDDGRGGEIPRHLFPRALWCLAKGQDRASHVQQALFYDWVFEADSERAQALEKAGIINVWWLPPGTEGNDGHANHPPSPHKDGDNRDYDQCMRALLDNVWRTPGLQSQYFLHVRPEILDLVPLTAHTVLDVGCATGKLGAAIKERQNCHVYGVELHPIASEKAREVLDHVFTGLLEDHIDEVPNGFFDCIILADVLEHTMNPWELLRLLVPKLAADEKSRIILSIPNAAHWTVVLPLLNGEWRYEDAGILDSTHLRFFTPTSVARLVQSAELTLKETRASIVPLPAGVNLGTDGTLKQWSQSGLAQVYQILCVCQRKPSPSYP